MELYRTPNIGLITLVQRSLFIVHWLPIKCFIYDVADFSPNSIVFNLVNDHL